MDAPHVKTKDLQIYVKGNLKNFGNLHFMVFNKLCTDVYMQNKIDTCEIEEEQVPKYLQHLFVSLMNYRIRKKINVCIEGGKRAMRRIFANSSR
jgi:hypothetical protein